MGQSSSSTLGTSASRGPFDPQSSRVVCCAYDSQHIPLFDDALAEHSNHRILLPKRTFTRPFCPWSPLACRVLPIRYPSDGQRGLIVTGYESPFTTFFYDLCEGQLVSEMTGHKTHVMGVASTSADSFSSPRIVSGGFHLHVYDAESGQLECTLPHPVGCFIGRILVVSDLCPDEAFVASAGGTVFRYNLNRRVKIDEFSHTDRSGLLYGLSASPMRHLLFSAGLTTLRIWSMTDCSCAGLIQLQKRPHKWGSPPRSESCVFIEDSNVVAVGRSDGDILMWDIRNVKRRLGRISGEHGMIGDMCVLGGTTCFVGLSFDGELSMYDSRRGKVLQKTRLGTGQARGVCVFEDSGLSGVIADGEGAEGFDLSERLGFLLGMGRIVANHGENGPLLVVALPMWILSGVD